MRTRWTAGGMVAALALATLAMAQDTGKPVESGAPSSGEGFFESIDVNVVNVDVYVTDKKGNRIKGLKKEDFELFEDRKPVAITNFYVVEEGEPQLEAVAPSEIPVARPGLPTEIPEDQRLHLVVYIDNANIRPFNRNRVFNSLRQFLSNNLTSEDRVMLMTYDREPHVRRSFTRDPNVVASALHEIEKINAMGLQADSDRREVLDEIERSNDYNYAAGRAASYADSARNDLQFALDSLKETVSSLSGLPGRKAILYVSDGLPMIVGQDVFQAVAEKFSSTSSSALMESLRYDESRRFIELAAQANASRVSFYTIDAAGLRVSSAVSAENRNANASGLVESTYVSNMQSPLRLLADQTGGKAIYNTNDPAKGLMTVADDFKSYYSLGYSPSHSVDGRYYKIEVRTKRKDLVVRHREGYRDKTTQSRMSDGVVSALFYDVESNGMGITVQRGREERRDDGHYLVPIEIRIPIGSLTLIPREQTSEAKLRVFFAAMDSDGGMSPVQESLVPISIPQAEVEQAVKQVYVYTLSMVMRKGSQKLAVGVRDEVGAAQAFTVRSLNVGGG
ncbi:MAG: VWA domain-containing protein [Thermoanaerobaculia bacterium]